MRLHARLAMEHDEVRRQEEVEVSQRQREQVSVERACIGRPLQALDDPQGSHLMVEP